VTCRHYRALFATRLTLIVIFDSLLNSECCVWDRLRVFRTLVKCSPGVTVETAFWRFSLRLWDFRFLRRRVWRWLSCRMLPCSVVGVYWRFRDTWCFHHQGDETWTLEVASTSETSVNLHQCTRRNSTQDSDLNLFPSGLKLCPVLNTTVYLIRAASLPMGFGIVVYELVGES
jgi:hypothetical protein